MQEEPTRGTHAIEHEGNAITLGASGALSLNRPPSNEHPSNCNPLILIVTFLPCFTSPDHAVLKTKVSIGCFSFSCCLLSESIEKRICTKQFREIDRLSEDISISC